jgi:hypothetical protein
LSSKTEFKFSIHTASTGPSNTIQQYSFDLNWDHIKSFTHKTVILYPITVACARIWNGGGGVVINKNALFSIFILYYYIKKCNQSGNSSFWFLH